MTLGFTQQLLRRRYDMATPTSTASPPTTPRAMRAEIDQTIAIGAF
jgi:hypothetical protein